MSLDETYLVVPPHVETLGRFGFPLGSENAAKSVIQTFYGCISSKLMYKGYHICVVIQLRTCCDNFYWCVPFLAKLETIPRTKRNTYSYKPGVRGVVVQEGTQRTKPASAFFLHLVLYTSVVSCILLNWGCKKSYLALSSPGFRYVALCSATGQGQVLGR